MCSSCTDLCKNASGCSQATCEPGWGHGMEKNCSRFLPLEQVSLYVYGFLTIMYVFFYVKRFVFKFTQKRLWKVLLRKNAPAILAVLFDIAFAVAFGYSTQSLSEQPLLAAITSSMLSFECWATLVFMRKFASYCRKTGVYSPLYFAPLAAKKNTHMFAMIICLTLPHALPIAILTQNEKVIRLVSTMCSFWLGAMLLILLVMLRVVLHQQSFLLSLKGPEGIRRLATHAYSRNRRFYAFIVFLISLAWTAGFLLATTDFMLNQLNSWAIIVGVFFLVAKTAFVSPRGSIFAKRNRKASSVIVPAVVTQQQTLTQGRN